MAQERQHFQAQLAAQLEAQRVADADVATAGGRGLHVQGAARRLLGALEVAHGLNGLAEVEFNQCMQFALSWVTVRAGSERGEDADGVWALGLAG
jgi:hypothetical protein